MPHFVYTGPSPRLTIRGRTLARGVAVELAGRHAEAAAAHPDVVDAARHVAATNATAAAAGGEGDLRATLGQATKKQLLGLAAERQIDIEPLGKRPTNAQLVEAIAAAIEEQDAAAGGGEG